jgi:hypothetical protein
MADGTKKNSLDVFFDEPNFRLTYFRTNVFSDEKRMKYMMDGLTENDVLVMNTGCWYNVDITPAFVLDLKTAQSAISREARDAAVAKLANQNKQFRALQMAYKMLVGVFKQKRRQPWLVIRETSPQHFDAPGGLWPGKEAPTGLATACKNRLLAEMKSIGKWRKTAAERILENVSILEVFDAAASAAAFHVGASHEWSRTKQVYDCTHYFLPGPVIDHWSYALHTALIAASQTLARKP